jgi:hypothetical protein
MFPHVDYISAADTVIVTAISHCLDKFAARTSVAPKLRGHPDSAGILVSWEHHGLASGLILESLNIHCYRITPSISSKKPEPLHSHRRLASASEMADWGVLP